jgi:hypothetical protein
VGQRRAVWICLGVLVGCALVAAGAVAQPQLKIESKESAWDLTEEFPNGIAIGTTAEHVFMLENTGTEPLQITEASPQGSFLTTVLPDEPIAPGQGAPLKVAFSTEGMEPGLIETYIVVKSNDPASETKPVVLTVKAHVIPRAETLLVVDPQERNIGAVRVGQKRRLSYKYQNAGSEEFEIFPLFFVDKRFQIITDIQREVLPPGAEKQFVLEFEPQPEDQGAELNALFIVKTGSEKQRHVICRVRGYIVPAEKKPEGVQIVPAFEAGEQPRYVFRISNNTGHAVEVVARRGEAEIRRLVVEPDKLAAFEAPVASEDDLKEIVLDVNLLYVSPEPTAPAAAEGEPAGTEAPETKAPSEPSTETESQPPAEGG